MKRTVFHIKETLTKEQLEKLERQNDSKALFKIYREVEGFVATKEIVKRPKLTIKRVAERTGLDVRRVERGFRRLDFLLYLTN